MMFSLIYSLNSAAQKSIKGNAIKLTFGRQEWGHADQRNDLILSP